MTPTTQELERYRTALTGHCYRMLGSVGDADDAAQEALVRAWRSLATFEGRSSVKTWLYRIATNVCLDHLATGARRSRPMEIGPAGTVEDPLEPFPRTHWLEPMPDAHALPADADPASLAILRQSIRLAFVAALQHLPPRQRAALLLSDVLGFSVAEVADMLESTVPAINSALQRARATLAERTQQRDEQAVEAALSEAQKILIDNFVDAFQRYDVDALATLLRDDVIMSMPPYALWLRGTAAVGQWLLGRGAACRGSRLVPTAACASPAFGQYKPGGPEGSFVPWALVVLELEGAQVAAMTYFLDTELLFPKFGLPPSLPR